MNKRGYILIFLVLMLFPLISAGITGQATSQETGITVSVISTPVLEITSPQNTTYTEGDYILLDWNENLIDTVWYNLDEGTNTTINTSFYFQTSVGSHTLYLYGNQSNGTVLSDSVDFTVQAAPPTGGGGGGSGRPREVIIEEEEIQEKIPVIIQQEETKQVKLLLKNEENIEKRIRIEDQNIGDLLIKVSDIEFYLGPEESREITLTFYASENKIPELYTEKIIIATDDYTKEVSFYVEVESLDFLFDVKVEIPEKPEIFLPGEELVAIVDFYNLGKEGESEVNIEYLIKDEQGKVIFGEKQSLIIGVSVTIIKRLDLPKNIQEGDYVFYVKATYDSKTASASKWFRIESKKIFDFGIIGERLSENKEKIAGAIAVLIGIYIISTSLEKLFGKRGKYHILKKRSKKIKRRKTKTKSAEKKRKSPRRKTISKILRYKK